MTAVPCPASVAELTELLHTHRRGVRLAGTGSRQQRLPSVPSGATVVSMERLDSIVRLDAADQTCSVDAGVRREALDDELHKVGLELPCLGGGTIGGLFASDPVGAGTAGGASPRTLLLGIEGLLADGTAFRCGSRVVKSVAGFDVHKLLIGSHGRLFAATRLHLRLRPRPRAEQWFRREGLDDATALALFRSLRALAVPPASLHLQRSAKGCVVAGRFAGRSSFVAGQLRALALPAGEPVTELHLELPPGGEVLGGITLPGAALSMLAEVDPQAPFVLHGGGRFELALRSPAATDTLLAKLPAHGIHACVVRGDVARRGVGTPIDAGQRRIMDGLKQALDPHGVLV